MSLNVSKVWKREGDQEILTSVLDISAEDEIVVHMGNIIPFDGIVTEGEAMVNQASLTGEPLPVHKSADAYVYAAVSGRRRGIGGACKSGVRFREI